MARRWLNRRRNERYFKRAKQEGYRSRAAYKLLQIQERFALLNEGDAALDLGAAPGGWSQVAVEIVGSAGVVVAVDKDPLVPIPTVRFVQLDIFDQDLLEAIRVSRKGRFDVILSDMAPALSGNRAWDNGRSLELGTRVLDVAQTLLRSGGCLVLKLIQGEGFPEFQRAFELQMKRSQSHRPRASVKESRETYLLGQGFRPIRTRALASGTARPLPDPPTGKGLPPG